MTGKDITVILSVNGTALANTRISSDDIKTGCETIEKASSTQQDWKEFIAGRKEWSLTVDYLVLATTKVADLLYAGSTFGITMKYGNTSLLTGTAICSSVSQRHTVGNLARGSFTFKGSGALAAA